MKIVVGTNDLKSGGTQYKVDSFIPHEKYDMPQFANDIALIRVQDEIQFNDKVQPIELNKEFIEAESKVEIYGWGKSDITPGAAVPWPDHLQVLHTTVISRYECRQKIPNNGVHLSHMCTFKVGRLRIKKRLIEKFLQFYCRF